MGCLIRSLVAGLGLVVLLGAPVAAGTSDSRYFQRGHHAFAWKEVCRSAPRSDIMTSKQRSNNVTGQILGSRFENGSVANSGALRVRFDELRGASVEGTIRVQVQTCPSRGNCVDSHRRMALDLEWIARPGPASESFTYSRTNDADCEAIYTDTRRGRPAKAVGWVGDRDIRASGWLTKSDVLITRVCQ